MNRWLLLAALVVAKAAGADQTISVALGLPAVEADWRLKASDRFSFGGRLSWDQLNREESLSLSAFGIAVPARFEQAFGRFTLSLEAAPGARRLAARFRDAGCGCIRAPSPSYALQLPATASLRAALSEAIGLSLFSTLGSDLLFSGGLLVSPQAGLALDGAVSDAVSLGVTARAGRVLAVGGVDALLLGGRRAITMPLAILLTVAVRF